MKKLLPLERISSVGRVHKLAAIVVAASVSCLPLAALADHTSGGGHGGGGGHPGGGAHAGGGGHPAGGGNHDGSFHAAPSYHPSAQSFQASVPSYHGSSRTAYSGVGRSATHTYHENLYARSNSASHGSNHNETATTRRDAATAEHRDPTGNRAATVNRAADTNHNLGQANRADAARNTSRLHDPARTPKAEALRARTSFDHSMTSDSAHGLMNQRLNQISNRQWSGHGAFFADSRGRGSWFNHGGYWWRCNYWGANWYCNNLIALGFAPGLCWAWYDDICWGNIAVGMPLDLVDYYYPDPDYSDYTTYDGDDATVYYYAMDDGQYRQVTVVDGNVVDVEIVDQIS